MINKTNVFICNRPIQYLNLRGILKNIDNSSINILFLFANFNGGKEFIDDIVYHDKGWSEIKLVKSKIELLKKIFSLKIDTLYINSDLGFDYLLVLFSKSQKTYVYEEGWGTYSNKQRILSLKGRLINIFYNLIGSGDTMGNSRLTTGVYVYKPKFFRKKFPNYSKEVKSFRDSFLDRVISEKKLFQRIFNYQEDINYSGKKILIYATGWNIDKNILNSLRENKEEFDIIFLKLHPHIRTSDFQNHTFKILNQKVMLELYLIDLLNQGNDITVYHDNSFSVLNFKDSIHSVNIGRSRSSYDDVIKMY